MEETKTSTANSTGASDRLVYWGTVVFAGFMVALTAVIAYIMATQIPWSASTVGLEIIVGLIVAVALTMNIASLVYTFRGRQEFGFRLSFFSMVLVGVSLAALIQARAPFISLFLVIAFMAGIGWLCRPQARRFYILSALITLALVWVIEWVNPPWRVAYHGASIGPVAAIIFAVIFLALFFLRTRTAIAARFLSFSLRTKFLISILGITSLAILIFGGVVLYRNQQSQNFWSTQLQTTVQQQSQQQSLDSALSQANSADNDLSRITLIVQQMAAYRAKLFSEANVVDPVAYWDGNTKLVLFPRGQYGNSASDPASVFIPNTVSVTPELINDLNVSMYLDFMAPAALQQNAQMIGLYYISSSNYSVYYPNINLARSTNADFNLLDQLFYTIATPQNDPQHLPVWTPPYQDPAGTGLIVTTSVPVYDQFNKFRGVMSADVQLSKITAQISTAQFGKTGFGFMIDPAGHIVSMSVPGYNFFGIEPENVPSGESPKTTLLGVGTPDFQAVVTQMASGGNGVATVVIKGIRYYLAYAPLPTIKYSIGLIAPAAELDAAYLAAQQQIGSQTRLSTTLSIITVLVLLLAAAGLSILLVRFFTAPLAQLTSVATEVAKGNLEAQAEVNTADEIGFLARTFNTMTSQLKGTFSTLEQRVTERTQSLELASEVGRAVSQVRSLDVMLREAAEIIRSRFDLYYTQVYLVNPSQNELVLQAGTGTVGADLLARSHRLPLNTGSINGRAAVEKHSVVIENTESSATFRPNPLLPETRSEMAVPLMIGENVVGVLDLQSRQPGGLKADLLPAFEALAGQFAIAIQNANLLAETERARSEMEKQARRLTRQNWTEYMDAIHTAENVGYTFENNAVVPATEPAPEPAADGKVISASIAVTGEPLGSLAVELKEAQATGQNEELVNTIARQVAQQIESLRLLDSAERYRLEAEEVAHQATRENWKTFIEAESQKMGFKYDLREVLPAEASRPDGDQGSVVPLKVRDEEVGQLSLLGVDPNDDQSLELASAVAERLAVHIESLRQFGQTQAALAQSEKLFDASRTLTQAKDLQELVGATVNTLEIPVINRAVLFIHDRNSDGELERMTVAANWWNGQGQEVIPLGTHLSKETFQSVLILVSPSPIIYNDASTDESTLADPASMAFVKAHNLHAVAALPLQLGSVQVGTLLLESEEPYNFNPEETRLFTSLAPQIATVLENRRQFERAQKQAERETTLNMIGQKIRSATTVEAVLQIAARELGHALGSPLTVAQLGMKNGK